MIVQAELKEKILKDVYMEVDGYYVFDSGKGSLTEYHLLCIIEVLKELNKPWDDQINAYFKQQELEASSPQEGGPET